jgi:hypothetical protein
MLDHMQDCDELLMAAFALVRGLRHRITPEDPITITIEAAGVVLRLLKRQGEVLPSPVRERGFSPRERSILTALAGGAWYVSSKIAAATGETPGSEFSALLTNLAEAGVLESSLRHGYRITPEAASREPGTELPR